MDDDNHDLAVEEHKRSLRAVMRRRLASLAPAERHSRSERLLARLTALPAWRDSSAVALFAPLASEPDIDLLWHGGHPAGRECFYPRVLGQNLVLQRVEALATLRPVPPWNLREPAPDAVVPASLENMDLILVPGLAFDLHGGRLGRGGGYYDRLLSTRRAGRTTTIGVGFEFQLCDRVPLAVHDARLDSVVLG